MKKPKFKKEKKQAYTEKEIEKIKRCAMKEGVDRTILLFLCATRDVAKIPEEQCVTILETVNRYSRYVDEHLIELEEAKEIAEKATGLKFNGWGNNEQ